MNGWRTVTNMKWRGEHIILQTSSTTAHIYTSSVEHLANVLRQAIENEQKLLNEITLPGAKFHIREVHILDNAVSCIIMSRNLFLSQSIITFIPSPPPTPPPSMEQPDPTYFTIQQLHFLHEQLYKASPTGWMLARTLLDTLHAMIQRSSKGDALPQLWRNASRQHVWTKIQSSFRQRSIYHLSLIVVGEYD